MLTSSELNPHQTDNLLTMNIIVPNRRGRLEKGQRKRNQTNRKKGEGVKALMAEREGLANADPKNSVGKDANAACAFCRPHQAPNPRTIHMPVYLSEPCPPDGYILPSTHKPTFKHIKSILSAKMSV